MSNLSDTNLSDIFVTLQNASELAHQFTKGDKTVIVEGSEGAYPSLAKIAADSQQALELNQSVLIASQNALTAVLHMASGVVAKTFHFEETMTLRVEHGMGTKLFSKTIINSNGDEIFAAHSVVDNETFLVEFTEAEAGVITVMFYLNT